MNNEIIIDTAKETDLPSIKTLLAELMGVMEDTEGFVLERSIENCRKLMQEPNNFVLVARDLGNLVGFINFTTRSTIMHPGPSGLIDELAVSKSSRGRGVGKQLVQEAKEKCRELGCCELEVSTEKSNRNARRFYKSCGFEEEAVLMEIDLDFKERPKSG